MSCLEDTSLQPRIESSLADGRQLKVRRQLICWVAILSGSEKGRNYKMVREMTKFSDKSRES